MKKSTQPIIEFRDVSLKFGQKIIFKNFNLKIKSGQQIVVFGKSGSGKSTLLKLLLGFEQPDSGEVYFNNKLITKKNIDWVRTQLAYVDQDVIIGEGQVIQLIKEYFSFKANQHLKLTDANIKQLLADFELENELLQKNISQLSGGERQRVALVMALLLKRPVMVLDEITSSLDPVSKKIAIGNLAKNKDMTLIIVTHDREWKKVKGIKLFDFKDKKWVL